METAFGVSACKEMVSTGTFVPRCNAVAQPVAKQLTSTDRSSVKVGIGGSVISVGADSPAGEWSLESRSRGNTVQQASIMSSGLVRISGDVEAVQIRGHLRNGSTITSAFPTAGATFLSEAQIVTITTSRQSRAEPVLSGTRWHSMMLRAVTSSGSARGKRFSLLAKSSALAQESGTHPIYESCF